MPRLPRTVLVVGGGLAGTRCAEALRAGGFGGRIVVVCEEAAPPYERPALSKAFLAARRDAASLALRPTGHWSELAIDLRLGTRVLAVDPSVRTATCSDGQEIDWDALALATGARARRLPGAPTPAGVHTLRTVADAAALRSELAPGRRLVVIGTGFVGLEVASTASELGVGVTVVGAEDAPLSASLGSEIGVLLAERMHGWGVGLRMATQVEGFDAGPDGRVRAVRIAGSDPLRCDVALVAVGAMPASELAAGLCTLAADGGCRTDGSGRTDAVGVYACGDAASPWRASLCAHRAIGHWTSASSGAVAVAAAILGAPAPEPEVPYFWSDAFGFRLQHVGGPAPVGAELVLDVAGDGASFEASYLRDGHPCAALVANRPHRVASLRRDLRAVPVPAIPDTARHELATRS